MAEIMFVRRNEQTSFRHQGDQQSFEEPFGVLCLKTANMVKLTGKWSVCRKKLSLVGIMIGRAFIIRHKGRRILLQLFLVNCRRIMGIFTR